MDRKTSEQQSAYKGRFGEGSVNAHSRPTGTFRTQPSGTYKYTRSRTESEYVPARDYIPIREADASEKKYRAQPKDAGNAPAKRSARKKRGKNVWIIAAAATVVAIVVALILLTGNRAPARMLPTVTPPETAAPEAQDGGAAEAPSGFALQVPEGASVEALMEDGQ